MAKWKNVKNLKNKIERLEAENEFITVLYGTEAFKNYNDKLLNEKIIPNIVMFFATGIALLTSPIIPITSTLPTVLLITFWFSTLPYYKFWGIFFRIWGAILITYMHPIITYFGIENFEVDVDNRWLLAIGFCLIVLALIISISILEKRRAESESL